MDAADLRALKAAAVLVQALALEDDPLALLPDLVAVSAEPAVAVYAAELDSSVGPAAFLVYVYDLATVQDGETGRQHFAADLATLQTAAERDAPGPRPVAHAETDDDAFILATSPATLRALGGESPGNVSTASPAAAPATGERAAARRAAAEELLRLLRAADAQAANWLAAAGSGLAPSAHPAGVPSPLTLTPEETELALFLLDDRSLRNLLRVLSDLTADARAGSRPPA